MSRLESYRSALKETAAILRQRYISATDLAKATGTSRETAYARIAALRALCTVSRKKDRVGRRGPSTTLFKITAGEVPEAPQ